MVEFLIFSEKHVAYQVFHIFVSFLSLISSYFYLYLASFRMINNVQDFAFFMDASHAIESVFMLSMILKFFKSYSPEGGGDLVKPVRNWYSIIFHYFITDFLMDFIPIVPLQLLSLKR